MSEEVLNDLSVTNVTTIESKRMPSAHAVEVPDYDREYFDDVAFMTSMLLVLLGNYRDQATSEDPSLTHRLTLPYISVGLNSVGFHMTFESPSTPLLIDSCSPVGIVYPRATRFG